MIGTQWTILTASLSLGGMVSMGLNHYLSVEEQLTQTQPEAEIRKMDEGELQRLLAVQKENLRQEFLQEKQGLEMNLQQLRTHLHDLESRSESHETMLGKVVKEQAHIEFKLETHDKSFRPLRTGSERLRRMEEVPGSHPLLPPVEESWSGY